MLAVGLDEILIVHDLDEDENCSIPIDIIRRVIAFFFKNNVTFFR